MDLKSIDYSDNETIHNEVSFYDKDGRLAVRKSIDELHHKMMDFCGSQRGDADAINEKGLKETLIDDVYIRQLTIPADTLIVSKIWKKERYWIIISGEVTFATEMGLQRVKAPFTKTVEPGSRVALYTHSEVLWIAVAGTKVKKLEDVENDVTVDDYHEMIYPWDNLVEFKASFK